MSLQNQGDYGLKHGARPLLSERGQYSLIETVFNFNNVESPIN